MPDILLDGLPVIDLLEITPSTSEVAQHTRRDQSSVSRIYRQVSDRLGLAFSKQRDGHYRAHANQELLDGLRRSSQWLRVHQRPNELRWVGHPGNRPLQAGAPPELPPAIERSWCDGQRTQWLLQQRILDLAVVPQPLLPPAGNIAVLPLLRFPTQLPSSAAQLGWQPDGGTVEVVLAQADLLEHATVVELIEAIRRVYQHHADALGALEWLG